MHKYKILIAEDNAAALRMVEKCFRLAGFKVYSTKTCQGAFKLIKEQKFDCLLLDYSLADGTASGICSKVRGDEKIKKTPIVIFSGHNEKSLDCYTDCQVDFFVEKDKTCKEVVVIVESLLRRLEWERGILKKSDIIFNPEILTVSFNKNIIIKLSPEQYRFFAIIFKKSPNFVDEKTMAKYVFKPSFDGDRTDALNSLYYRLRSKLGPRLASRLKAQRHSGWKYVQPKSR